MPATKEDIIYGNVWRLISQIRDSLRHTGCQKLVDSLREMDTHNEKLISESDFFKALKSSYSSLALMDKEDANLLSKFLQVNDGRIMYETFCQLLQDGMETEGKPFTTGLEWVNHNKRNVLNLSEEVAIESIISKIAAKCMSQNFSLKPYFAEYEMIANGSGYISIAHLGKIFYKLNIILSPEDYGLFVKRYGCFNYNVNYVAMLDDILNRIEQFSSAHENIEPYLEKDDRRLLVRAKVNYEAEIPDPHNDIFSTGPTFHRALYPTVEVNDALNSLRHIQHKVIFDGIDFRPLFRDHDPNRTGRVTVSQFKRILSFCGIGDTGNYQLRLTKEDMDHIVAIYKDPLIPEEIQYENFIEDAEKANHLKQCEKDGPGSLLRSEQYNTEVLKRTLKPQHNVWEAVPKSLRDVLEEALQHIKMYNKKTRHTTRYLCRELDRRNFGYINELSFLNMLLVYYPLLTKKQKEALIARYVCHKGFDYRQLIFDLGEDSTLHKTKYGKKDSREILEAQTHYTGHIKKEADVDIKQVLQTIRARVLNERINLYEFFTQFDPLNKKSVNPHQFVRALMSATLFTLTENEINCLLKTFTRPFSTDQIEYCRFIDAVEGSNRDLTKNPMVIPFLRLGVSDGPFNFLNLNERIQLEEVLEKFSGRPELYTVDLFKDVDTTRRGTVTQFQLRRALENLGINVAPRLSANDVDILFKGFGKLVGPVLELDYFQLVSAIQNMIRNRDILS